MADTLTPNISTALYCYLCQNIVGTEDRVKTIRMTNAVRDNFSSNRTVTFITSGSFGEGLELRCSDFDIMYVDKDIEVYENVKPRSNRFRTYLSMETDDVKPGFTRLRLEQSIYPKMFYLCEKHGYRNFYFSSALYRHSFLTDGSIVHGPCISDKHGEIDGAFSLHCKTWVSSAIHWITRSSNSWPSPNIKQSIINHGVLFVPIGVKGSPKEDIEWRVSFSVGEKLLINLFTHTQLLCYTLLKILLKDVIATYSDCKDLLCSYFMKTIIFWICEELPQSIWKPQNLISCFMRCFRRLVYCVEHSVCMHYFIPENNLFENKIEGTTREILLQKLHTLYSYGWRCILFSDQLSDFYASIMNLRIQPYTFYVNDIEKILKSKFLFRANFTYHSFDISLGRIIHEISCQRSYVKHFYAYSMSLKCNGYAHCIPLDRANSNNKYRYKQFKTCLSTLLKNVNHDAVSGWLTIATLFYKTKQYNIASNIIMYSISKCSSEKLYRWVTVSDMHNQSLQLRSLHKKNCVGMLKIMLVDYIRFKSDSTLTPVELCDRCNFSSTAYAYFLNCLCHFHLNNVRQYQDSYQGLQLVLKEEYLIREPSVISNSYLLLAVASKLLGDDETTRHAILQSVKESHVSWNDVDMHVVDAAWHGDKLRVLLE